MPDSTNRGHIRGSPAELIGNDGHNPARAAHLSDRAESTALTWGDDN
jgi:hypothetical protein